jgi:hypothetical protein
MLSKQPSTLKSSHFHTARCARLSNVLILLGIEKPLQNKRQNCLSSGDTRSALPANRSGDRLPTLLALVKAGIVFIPENGGGAGVRVRKKRPTPKALPKP